MGVLTFYKGDKVRLIDGRIGTVICKCEHNAYYYKVCSYDSVGNRKHYNIFNLDMRLIKRKMKNERDLWR